MWHPLIFKHNSSAIECVPSKLELCIMGFDGGTYKGLRPKETRDVASRYTYPRLCSDHTPSTKRLVSKSRYSMAAISDYRFVNRYGNTPGTRSARLFHRRGEHYLGERFPELALFSASILLEYFYTKIRFSAPGSAPTCQLIYGVDHKGSHALTHARNSCCCC
jgi:hypothetical protein